MKLYLLIFLLCISGTTLVGQSDREKTIANFEKEYQKRIKKERLFGVYIPADLADAFTQLNRLTAPDSKKVFKNAPEEMAVRKLHFSLGRWMIHNWGFYEGSRLSHYIKGLGVTHPDQQASLIIRSYHRYLNKAPLDIEEQVTAILEKQKEKNEEKKKKGTVIHTETRKKVN